MCVLEHPHMQAVFQAGYGKEQTGVPAELSRVEERLTVDQLYPLFCSGYYNKILWTGRLKQQIFILHGLEAGSPRSGCQQGWFLVRPLVLAGRWLPSCCGLSSVRACTCLLSPVLSILTNAVM